MTDLSAAVRLSCLLEATSRKAGNVHPGAAFKHLSYQDFVRSGQAIAPVLAQTKSLGVGPAILRAVRATREVCQYNTNLGIVLLLAPLAAVPSALSLRDGLPEVLGGLSANDAEAVYEAIRLANPRGLGRSDEADVETSPDATLLDAMALAKDRDQIAAEYCLGFPLVLAAAEWLAQRQDFANDWESTIQWLQLRLMASHPDTDIQRKCDRSEALDSARRAQLVLDAGFPHEQSSQAAWQDFDRWLRQRDSLRNPGTTADLVTASLFAAIRDGLILPPPEDQIHDRALLISRANGSAE